MTVAHSNSVDEYFLSAVLVDLLAYTIGCQCSSSPICSITTPSAARDASVKSINDLSKSG